MKPQLSAFVLSFNEADNIEACLQSLRDCTDEIFLVDSGSTDATREIASRYDCVVVENKFEGHSKQRNWALRNLPFKHEWVIALDSDHRVTPELAEELRQRFASPPQDVNGFFMKRRQIFRGHWIRHGGYYPKWQLKIFKHRLTSCDDHEFDYRYYVPEPVGKLHNDILEDNRKERDIGFWIAKHNKFAGESAVEEEMRRDGTIPWRTVPRFYGNPDERVLWLKDRWYHMPLFVRPFVYFFYRYFIKLGFLDGKQGFIFHFMQAFWFRLLVDIHLDQMRAQRRSENELVAGRRAEAI